MSGSKSGSLAAILRLAVPWEKHLPRGSIAEFGTELLMNFPYQLEVLSRRLSDNLYCV